MALTGVHLPLRRINPFQGLMIDATTWHEAHEYHRDQLRLHHQALHGVGVVSGLEIGVAGADNTLLIGPGVAIDPEGNFIVLTQPQRYRVQSRERGTVYLIIQFREVPAEPAGESGQPTRIVEAFRIQERDRLPSEPYLELARIDYDPGGSAIALPAVPEQPRVNELDTRFRLNLGQAGPPLLSDTGDLLAGAVVAPVPPPPSVGVPGVPIAPVASTGDQAPIAPATEPALAAPARTEDAPVTPPAMNPAEARVPQPAGVAAGAASAASAEPPAAPALRLAMLVQGEPGWDRRRNGLTFLARELRAATGHAARVLAAWSPAEPEPVDLLYVRGQGRLALDDETVAGIADVLDKGGIVIGDGCAHGPAGESGAREFAFSFAELARRLGRQLAQIDRGHQLLVSRHVFGSPPQGAREDTRVLEAGGMVLCSADYGCAWVGGPPDRPLPRGAIRDALEFGVNLAVYRREDSSPAPA